MAKIKPVIQIEIDPANLVQELCAVISAVVPKQPEREVKLLEDISGALQRRIGELRGAGQSDE